MIYLRWDDVDYPPDMDATAVATRFFGTGFPSTTFPSVGDYFRRLSFNDLFLFPAAESQGAFQDGVVQVTVPGTKADFFTLPESARNRLALELADPFVDFSSFDTNGDGFVTNLELVVNVLEAEPDIALPGGCGITRSVGSLSLDGTTLALSVAMNNTATNLITIIHENAHVAVGLVDLYGFDVGRLDIGGATCSLPDDTLFAPSAWYKLHWGWITPTVVTRDGYYEIPRADTSGAAFLLYDPDRGPDDYFLVENRRPTPGTYDQGASGDGLVIWRVADAALGVDVPIGLVRPSPTRHAWNAADPAAPQRTMDAPWTDGTPAQVSVRAIGNAGEVMRAYFDVRGPGVLVDTYPLDAAGPVPVTAAGSNIIDVPVMNTGETGCDTFVFEPVNMPAAWTMSPGARILCAGESSFGRMTVTPDANAAVGVHTILIRGRSLTDPAVVTESPLRVDVILRPTHFGLGALLTATATGTATTFQAHLSPTDDPSGSGLEGVPVTFTLEGPGGTLTLATTTNADGVATVTTHLTLPPGTYTLTIESERLGEMAPTQTVLTYDVLSIEGALEHVVEELAELMGGASPQVRSALQAAVAELIGNNGGAANNGALDKLAAGAPVPAIIRIQGAISRLLAAEAQGAGDLWQLLDLLALAAEAIATAEYEAAQAAVGTPNAGEARALAQIGELIATGQAYLQGGEYLDACKAFKQAASKAQGLGD